MQRQLQFPLLSIPLSLTICFSFSLVDTPVIARLISNVLPTCYALSHRPNWIDGLGPIPSTAPSCIIINNRCSRYRFCCNCCCCCCCRCRRCCLANVASDVFFNVAVAGMSIASIFCVYFLLKLFIYLRFSYHWLRASQLCHKTEHKIKRACV